MRRVGLTPLVIGLTVIVARAPAVQGVPPRVRASASYAATMTKPKPPNANVLLARMSSAMRRVRSAHFTSSGTYVEPHRERTVFSSHGDISAQSERYHEIVLKRRTLLFGKRKVTFNERDETIVVSNRGADRIDTGPWQCTTLPKRPATAYVVLAVRAGAGKPVNLGASFVRGAAVWRLRVPFNDKRAYSSGRITYYIRRSNYVVLRETMLERYHSGAVRTITTSTKDYSRYGESVAVELPTVCRHRAASLRDAGLAP